MLKLDKRQVDKKVWLTCNYFCRQYTNKRRVLPTIKSSLEVSPGGKKRNKKLFPLLSPIMDKRFESLKIGNLSVKGKTKRKKITREEKFFFRKGGGDKGRQGKKEKIDWKERRRTPIWGKINTRKNKFWQQKKCFSPLGWDKERENAQL